MSFHFEPFDVPREWLGPYSPRRGANAGFTVRNNNLEVPLETEDGTEILVARKDEGVRALVDAVVSRWWGGRVLFLPNGIVVKPLADEENLGTRVAIGRFGGSLVLEDTEGNWLDLSDSSDLEPGEPWPGPRTIGLEAHLRTADSSVRCTTSVVTDFGQEEQKVQLPGRHVGLAKTFRKVRPMHTGGRIRITGFGDVFTFVKKGWSWEPVYLGRLSSLPDGAWDEYLGGEWK